MKPFTLQQIRTAVGGRALSTLPDNARPITAVCTDTRSIEPGSLFVALRGDRFDGHNFLPDAAAGGVVAAIVDSPPATAQPNVYLIQVPDTRVALGKLAQAARRQLRSKVVAVAGSNGKTSTKHLIDAALHRKLRGSISPKSYNNDIGVPLAIFPADPLADYLVLEMGTNHHGEIEKLSKMAEPDIAVITNCGAEHLEFLDDLMGVRRENACITAGMSKRGMLIVNGDDPELLAEVKRYPGKTFTFGFNPTNDLFASDVISDEHGVRFKLNGSRTEVFIPLLGKHTASNALAAIAVARKLGVGEKDMLDGLREAHGADMRLQLQAMNGVLVLNDAYNANPNSMRAALETLLSLPTTGRRIAILGDMRELGTSSDRFHTELGEFAALCKLDALVCVGKNANLLADAAIRAGMRPEQVSRFEHSDEAAAKLPMWIEGGDILLLKASRAVRLENIAAALSMQRLDK